MVVIVLGFSVGDDFLGALNFRGIYLEEIVILDELVLHVDGHVGPFVRAPLQPHSPIDVVPLVQDLPHIEGVEPSHVGPVSRDEVDSYDPLNDQSSTFFSLNSLEMQLYPRSMLKIIVLERTATPF